MITRIELTNFMSHVHTVIEPAAGLTVLVGPNNCGKSAVVAALQILCRNENSTYVLRHGERECCVKMVTDDGHTIEWRRKNSPKYVIDGKEFDRLKGNLPEELHAALRLPTVDAGSDSDFDVHFGTQKSPIFLLGGSPANAARFFASSSDAIRLVQMLKRHKEKLQDAQREKNRLEAESKQINAELTVLEPVVDLDRQVKLLETTHREVLSLATLIAGAQTTVVALEQQAEVIAGHAAETEALGGLKLPPALSPTAGLENLLVDLPDAAQRSARFAAEGQVLALLEAPPSLFDVVALEANCERLAALEHSVAKNDACGESLAGLTAPPALADTDTLAAEIRKLNSARQGLQAVSSEAQALTSLRALPVLVEEQPLAALLRELAASEQRAAHCAAAAAKLVDLAMPIVAIDLAPVQDLLSRLDAAAAQVKLREAEFSAAAAAVDAAGAELRTMATGRLCPICAAPLDPDRMLAAAAGPGGHTHG